MTACKPGDVVLPRHINVVTLGDADYHVTFEDGDVLAVVENVDRSHVQYASDDDQ